MTLEYMYRHVWMRQAEESPGKYVSENGKWVLRKEGLRRRTYLKDHLPCSPRCATSLTVARGALHFLKQHNHEPGFQRWAKWLSAEPADRGVNLDRGMQVIVNHGDSHGTCGHDPLPADFGELPSAADAAFARKSPGHGYPCHSSTGSRRMTLRHHSSTPSTGPL
jgi:hypothetical protein